MVNVKILLFASARELAGTSEGMLTNVPAQTDQKHLMDRILNEFSLKRMEGSVILAHNQEFVLPGERVCLHEGDELAVIPPLSGG